MGKKDIQNWKKNIYTYSNLFRPCKYAHEDFKHILIDVEIVYPRHSASPMYSYFHMESVMLWMWFIHNVKKYIQ